MQALDEQHVFDATGTAMSVRWADPDLQQRKKKVMDDVGADTRGMIFFAKVLRSTTEEEVRRLFSRFGKVHEVNLFRAFQGAPTTKGCGLVTMLVHDEALAAIGALDGKFVWEGMDCPMVVKWMDTALQRRRREQHATTGARTQLPSASIGGLLGGGAQSRSSNEPLPYTPYAAAAAAAAAQSGSSVAASLVNLSASALGHGGADLSGLGGAGQLSAGGLGGLGGLGMGGVGVGMSNSMLGAAGMQGGGGGVLGGGGGASYAGLGGGGVGMSGMGGVGMGMGGLGGVGVGGMGGLGGAGAGLDGLMEAMETPPPGCAPDAMKLFVGNIPKSCTEDQLLPLFQSIGKVVELVIVYDKVTHESKGSAFVWYANRADAERAIIQFNLRHVFPDPSGVQDRPLVVRRAKARSRAVLGPLGFGGIGGMYGLTQPGGFGLSYGAPQPAYQRAGLGGGGAALSIAQLQAGMEGLGLGGGSGAGRGMRLGGGGGNLLQPMTVMGPGGMRTAAGAPVQMQLQGNLMAMGPGGQAAGFYDAYNSGDQLISDLSMMGGGQQGGGGGGASPYMAFGTSPTGSLQQQPLHATPHVGGVGTLGPGDSGQWDSRSLTSMNLPQQQQQQPGSATMASAQAQQQQQQQAQQQAQQQQQLTVSLNSQQLGAVNQHLYSVQTVSGATLQLSPGAGGMFALVINGTPPQVEAARSLVATVVGGQI
eukprot:XP_001695396.1 RNA-binding protein [Chlamydomonas reinhardtii]